MIKKLKYIKYYSKVILKNWKGRKDSYSQHGEDKIIELLLPGGVNSFIDIGANDGVLFSNTYKFAKNGAIGLCIEPSPKSYIKLYLNHLPNWRVKTVNLAISIKNSEVYLNEDGYEQVLSKVSLTRSNSSKVAKCINFDKLIAQYPRFKNIDLLSVDVEDHEYQVFCGLTDPHFSSKVIILESNLNKLDELIKLNSLRNYIPICHNYLNIILKHKDENLVLPKHLPPNFERI